MIDTSRLSNLITPEKARIWFQLVPDGEGLYLEELNIEGFPDSEPSLSTEAEGEEDEEDDLAYLGPSQVRGPEDERWDRFEEEYKAFHKIREKQKAPDYEPEPRIYGGLPSWLQCDRQDFSWADLLGFDEYTSPHPCGMRMYSGGMDWALENCIAPYQPFLVEFKPSVWTKDYWGEWDTNFYNEIVAILPLPAETLAKLWDEYLQIRLEIIESYSQEVEELRQKRLTDLDALHITVWRDDYGLMYRLRTDHYKFAMCGELSNDRLAESYDYKGRPKVAWRRLMEDVRKKNLPFPEKFLKTLIGKAA